MTACSRGDVVLVRFPFLDGTGVKRRPAVVVSSTQFHRARQEVILAAVTSNVRRQLLGDHLVKDWKRAGLLFPSVVTGILRTVKQTMVERRLGALPEGDLELVERELRRSLGL
jgi:mRNA interferase MazF